MFLFLILLLIFSKETDGMRRVAKIPTFNNSVAKPLVTDTRHQESTSHARVNTYSLNDYKAEDEEILMAILKSETNQEQKKVLEQNTFETKGEIALEKDKTESKAETNSQVDSSQKPAYSTTLNQLSSNEMATNTDYTDHGYYPFEDYTAYDPQSSKTGLHIKEKIFAATMRQSDHDNEYSGNQCLRPIGEVSPGFLGDEENSPDNKKRSTRSRETKHKKSKSVLFPKVRYDHSAKATEANTGTKYFPYSHDISDESSSSSEDDSDGSGDSFAEIFGVTTTKSVESSPPQKQPEKFNSDSKTESIPLQNSSETSSQQFILNESNYTEAEAAHQQNLQYLLVVMQNVLYCTAAFTLFFIISYSVHYIYSLRKIYAKKVLDFRGG